MPGFHSVPLVLFAFAIILACYGGGFGTMPSFNADYFGTKYLGQNYGYIITAWGVAGLVGPYIAGAVKDATGSFSGALMPMAVMLLIAMILPFLTKKPAPAPAASSSLNIDPHRVAAPIRERIGVVPGQALIVHG